MSQEPNPVRIPAPAYEQAAEWFVCHREGALGEAVRQSFDAWLRASPQNVQAYLEISSTWEDVPRLDAGWNPAAQQLITQERGITNIHALSALGAPRSGKQTATPAAMGGNRKWFALAASILTAAVLTGVWLHSRPPTYVTAVGEQRLIALPDGSTLKLNARSRVQLRFTSRERYIELQEGQGLFDVAKDPARPFVVGVGATRVQAVGTRFDIYRKASAATVTVIEGRVLTEEVMLSAGQQMTVATRTAVQAPRATPPRVVKANIEAATAWTQRRLVFRSSPLSEVVEEFNRYNARPLSVADPALADYRISGVFSSTDPDPLLRFLRLQKGMRVTESDLGIRISQK